MVLRGPTSLDCLQLQWDYPVHVPPTNHRSTRALGALPTAKAFAEIADGDPRPLLILRETDDVEAMPLLALRQSMERTRLLARWFHCIELPIDVLARNHAYRNVFDKQRPARIKLCLADGSQAMTFADLPNERDLQRAMTKLLDKAYVMDTRRPTRQLIALLDELDRVDAELIRLERSIDQLLEQNGGRARRSARLSEQLAAANTRRQRLRQSERSLRDLGRTRAKSN